MEIIEMNLPSFLRIQYPTNALRDTWSEKIKSASKLYELELQTVLHGFRETALVPFHKSELAAKMNEYYKKGLIVLPIDVAPNSSGFIHNNVTNITTNDYNYHCFITSNRHVVSELMEARDQRDNQAFGRLLGYPTCCTEHFDTYWDKGVVDPAWHQGINTPAEFIVNTEERLVRLTKECPTELTTIFRYFGVRLTTHLPCSFTCESSLQGVKELNEFAIGLGYEQSIKDTYDILNLPFEWSNLKGNAIISTPAFKFMVNSNTCTKKHIVQKESDFYPEGAPTAVSFPWKQKGSC